jgi:heme exporter protein CcmC
MSMFIYCVMAFWAAIGITFNTRLSGMMSAALAPTGALFAFLSLWTGALWGKPMWGAWWVWDARLTSELILFFLYLGYIALTSAIDDPRRADKAGAIVALVGVVNVPIIYFSVKWWNTLHQGASVSLTKAPSMATTMLWGMLLMALAFWMYSIAIACTGCGRSSSNANTTPAGWPNCRRCSDELGQRRRILCDGRLRPLCVGQLRRDRRRPADRNPARQEALCRHPPPCAGNSPPTGTPGLNHETPPETPRHRRRRPRRHRHCRRADPQRLPEQPGVLLHPDPGGQRRGAQGRAFRIGGLVKEGSLQRTDITARFVVTDTAKEIPVSYKGILPDLFSEGKGVVAQGSIGPTACSPPPRCSPSTTRTTCRPKPRPPSTRPTRPPAP